MSFRIILRPKVERDIADAAMWYENKQEGLGGEFAAAVLQAIDALSENPLLVSRRHRRRNIRWSRTERFPYRIIFEVTEHAVLVIACCIPHATITIGRSDWRIAEVLFTKVPSEQNGLASIRIRKSNSGTRHAQRSNPHRPAPAAD